MRRTSKAVTSEIEKTASIPILKRIFFVLVLWSILFCIGFSGLELYARSLRGMLLFHQPLEASRFHEMDRVRIWNRRFRWQSWKYFREWPIEIKVFDAKEVHPKYKYLPEKRMVKAGSRLRPARKNEHPAWSSNSLGLRNPEVIIPKPPDVYRIVCLGASTTEGARFPEALTYPRMLEEELRVRRSSLAIEVINAGHSGLAAADLVEILKETIVPLDPDLIIYYQANNNIRAHQFLDLGALECHIGWPGGTCWLQNYSPIFRFFYRESALFGIFVDAFGWTAEIPPPMPHRLKKKEEVPSLYHYEKALGSIVELSKSAGIPIMLSSFVTFAHEGLVLVRDSGDAGRSLLQRQEEALQFDELYKNWYPLTPEEIAQIFDIFNEVSLHMAQKYELPYADISAVYPRKRKYFSYDLIHFTPEGNRILAELFADAVEGKVWDSVENNNHDASTLLPTLLPANQKKETKKDQARPDAGPETGYFTEE